MRRFFGFEGNFLWFNGVEKSVDTTSFVLQEWFYSGWSFPNGRHLVYHKLSLGSRIHASESMQNIAKTSWPPLVPGQSVQRSVVSFNATISAGDWRRATLQLQEMKRLALPPGRWFSERSPWGFPRLLLTFTIGYPNERCISSGVRYHVLFPCM